jgi:type IV pilus assembly protein PilB
MARLRKKLGQILVSSGVLNAEQADRALKHGKQTGKRIGEAAVELGLATEKQIAKALAEQYGFDYIDLDAPGAREQIDRSLLDENIIKKFLVLPLGKAGGKMRLLIHDPMDLELLDNLRFRLNMDIEPRIAPKSQIRAFIEGGPGGTSAAPQQSLVTDSIDRSVDRSVDRSMDKSIDVASEDSPVVKLCNRILEEAVECGPATSTSSRWATGSACATASTVSASNATISPSACRTRCSPASSSWPA